MTLGKLAYKVFFKPTLNIRYYIAHFGLTGWIEHVQNERKMMRWAEKEQPITLTTDNNAITLSYLTGKKYWHQTIYCIKSLDKVLNGKFKVNIYSDGTLNATHIKTLKKFISQATVFPDEDMDKQLDQKFPIARYPVLRQLRQWHPFFRRLIDIHSQPGWTLHLDSDMLFFKKPDEIINAYNSQQAIFMQDQLNQSYFVDDELALKNNYNIECIKLVNGGIIGYNNDAVDYDDLEEKAAILLTKYPNAIAAEVEQTLMSYLLFKQNATGLDAKRYKIYYDWPIANNNTDVVRHYIFKAKFSYFKKEWKQLL